MVLKTFLAHRFSIENCRLNFKSLFIFGDNLQRVGMGGQAIIREQPNAIGLATKKAPSNEEGSFFTDTEYEENCKIIDEDIQRIKDYAQEMGANSYVFPQMGLGTGLSDMQRKCPKTFCYLTVRLIDEFQFNNLEFLQSKPM